MAEVILTTSILIIAILVFRQIARDRVSPTLIYAVWLLAAVRILIPLPFSQYMPKPEKKVITVVETKWQLNESILSAKKDGEAHYFEGDAKLSEILPGEGKKPSEAIGDLVEKSEALVDKPASPLAENGALVDKSGEDTSKADRQFRTSVIIWLAGTMTVTAMLAAKNGNFAAKLRKNRVYFETVDGINIYVVEQVGAPFVFGIIKPAIYIDRRSLEREGLLNCVLEHELGHIKHRDYFWHLVRWGCVVLQWFNPLVWAAALISLRDAEFACDYYVICKKDRAERLDYGRSLISLAVSQKQKGAGILCSQALPFKSSFLKKRISKIGEFSIIARSRNIGAAIIAAMLFAVAVVGCGSPLPVQNTVETIERAQVAELTRNRRMAVVGEDSIALEAKGYLPTDPYENIIVPWMDGFYVHDEAAAYSDGEGQLYLDLKAKRASEIKTSGMAYMAQTGADDNFGSRWADHRYLIDKKLYTFGTEKNGRDAMYVSEPDGSDCSRICYFDEGMSPYKAWIFLAYDRDNQDIYYFSEKLEKENVDFDKNFRYIIRMNMETKQQERVGKVKADIDMRRYGVAGDNIFYMRNEKITAYSIGSGKEESFNLPNKAEYGAWRIYDNKLYYMGKDNNTVLYMDLMTGEENAVGQILSPENTSARAYLTDYMWDGRMIFYVLDDKTGESSYIAMSVESGDKKPCGKFIVNGIYPEIVAETKEAFVLIRTVEDGDSSLYMADDAWERSKDNRWYAVIDKDDYWKGSYEKAKALG